MDDSFMALSLTESLAQRAIDSIKLGGGREVRNSLALFRSFFERLGLKYVPFYRARYIQTFKVNPYSFIKRLVGYVDKDILKSFITNMVYSVFTKGSSIKSNDLSWIFDLTYSKNIKKDITSYNDKGVYAFFINTDILCTKCQNL